MYFATEYTIHFDDTMAYGSHHFLTSFKFQCEGREAFLFGDRIFDSPGVRDALDRIHLLTADAYARNLKPAKLGDRLAILLTLEEWGRASARFCYRVINEHGQPICAGFQTLLCADAESGMPVMIPEPLWDAMEQLREIEEPSADQSFRDRVLAGGSKTESLFGSSESAAAMQFLSERYPTPGVVAPTGDGRSVTPAEERNLSEGDSAEAPGEETEVWVFAGQGAFDARLLSERVDAYARLSQSFREELDECAAIAGDMLSGDASGIVSGDPKQCAEAVKANPDLSQVAIHLQNVLGAEIRRSRGYSPAAVMGHSFGELAAFCVGGCFGLTTGVRVVCQRVLAIKNHAPPAGGLLAVSAGRHTVSEEVALLGLSQVVIAGRNHEQQTIASGPGDELDRLCEHLQSLEFNATRVPTPTSFHHPRLRDAASVWLQRLRALPLAGPNLSVYSPIGRRFIPADDDIAATLASQLLIPFDLQGAVSDLITMGASRFVDCGSSGTLAKLLSKAAADEVDVVAAEFPSQQAADDSRSPQIAGNNGVANGQRPEAKVAAPVESAAVEETATEETEPDRRSLPRVALVGQGCVLPAGVRSPEDLHSAIAQQRSGIVDLREYDPHWEDDFYSAELVPDRTTTPLTGRVNDEDLTVPEGVDRETFEGFTRTQQLLCIALAPCIRSLEGADRVLCFIGATADGFEDQDAVSSLRYAGIDPTDPVVDGRLHTLRSAFQEPHDAVQEVFDKLVRPGLKIMIVDAACASSLYAVALGMHALETDEADAVVAGGVFCPGPGNSCLFSQFQATSSTGCRPFDAESDGVIFSEGAALVALRRLADAESCGLPVSAVLKGCGLSSDGRSPSANVPQTHGQIISLERCYATYGIDPASIDAIEGHGTSTPAGDSTEVETLRRFYADHTTRPIPLHSLKGLMGHTGWAAGTTSVIAACEYLRNSVFPAQAHRRQLSQALIKAGDVLHSPTSPLKLPEKGCCIAVDGFGFGGANAHVVLERYSPEPSAAGNPRTSFSASPGEKEDLVLVAYEELKPTVETPDGMRFDRENAELPEGHILLPDLQEDMDVSQALAIRLADGVTKQFPDFDADMRRKTGFVLAQVGKTDRGVEATLRILASRFRRDLAGIDPVLAKLEDAYGEARPSGPYTLQCMMPNVASGRAALRFNLNGPNFVVDSGSESLEEALRAASLLLRSSPDCDTKMVIVAAIDASPWRVPHEHTNSSNDEYAAAFAVTTRQFALDNGLTIVKPLDSSSIPDSTKIGSESPRQSMRRKVRGLLGFLRGTGVPEDATSAPAEPALAEENPDFADHTLVWVESPLPDNGETPTPAQHPAIVAVVKDDLDEVADLIHTLPRFSERHMIAVVGPSAAVAAATFGDSSVVAIDLHEESSADDALRQISGFRPDVVAAFGTVGSWDSGKALSGVASENGLCEFLFLVAKHCHERTKTGAMELWGVFLNAWNEVVHPASGATAGLLKAIKRELPSARATTLCTRGLSLVDAIQCMLQERFRGTPAPEVVYDGTTRMVRRLRRLSYDSPAVAQVDLNKDSVVVASGGARGVTAVMLEALLRDHRCTVVALGRSKPEPCPSELEGPDLERYFYERFSEDHPRASAAEMRKEFERACARWEAHETIQRLASTGGRVEYLVADVTDRAQTAQAVEHIVSRYGRIDLLVHGAGVQKSKLLEHRSLDEFRCTYAVKVHGLRNLVEESRRVCGKTVSVHALTSAYSVFGNDGQHDYGAANESLDRLCGLTENSDAGYWTSIAWLAWKGIGMTRGSEYDALAEQRGLSGVTEATGQKLFREVISGSTHARINVPMSPAEHTRYEMKTIPPKTDPAACRVLEVPVELSSLECLPFHKVRSTPTLPGAWILEFMVNAALKLNEDARYAKSVVVRNTTFRRFVRQTVGREPDFRVVAEQRPEAIHVWLLGDVLHASGAVLSKDNVFAEADISFSDAPEDTRPRLEDFASLDNGHQLLVVDDPYCNNQRSIIQLSGPFDCVRDVAISPIGRRGRYVPGEKHRYSDVVPALLLDSAWRVGAMHARPGTDELYAPVKIGRLVLPIGSRARTCELSESEIRATAPWFENGHVRWDRTEVLNNLGEITMLVEDAFATPVK